MLIPSSVLFNYTVRRRDYIGLVNAVPECVLNLYCNTILYLHPSLSTPCIM
jgi:hypothetical protein